MPRILSDAEINALLNLSKPLPKGWRKRLLAKDNPDDGHLKKDLKIPVGKSFFMIRCRRSRVNPLDFSIILQYSDETGNQFRLLRCNGKHPSKHTNKMESQIIGPGFHIHLATERYQVPGYDIDGYAEITSEYSDFLSALEFFVKRCAFVDPEPPHPQTRDFLEELR